MLAGLIFIIVGAAMSWYYLSDRSDNMAWIAVGAIVFVIGIGMIFAVGLDPGPTMIGR